MYESVAAVVLIALLALYLRGLLVARARGGRIIHRALVFAFVAGWATLVGALLSPLHEASEQIFSAHMVQHELIMALAAPLLVVARPLAMVMLGLPGRARRTTATVLRAPAVRRAWSGLTRPLDAWLFHGAAIWVWHIPLLFQSTLHSELSHALQHLSFFASAVVFWWSILHGRRAARGVALMSLFITAVHTSVLGALLTFAHLPWYPEYADGAALWHLTPLGDQQLAGLIMWVPASAAYLVAALAVMRRWLQDSEWAVIERERRSAAPAAT